MKFWIAGAVLVALAIGSAFYLVPSHDGESPQPELADAPWFADVTDAAGIDFVHDADAVGDYHMPQIVGSGAAVLDFDGDGKPDLLLLNNGGPASKATNKLYRNLGGGKFADVSQGSGLDFAGHCMGAAVGDVNNDGRPDVLITLYAGARLFLNEGSGRFKDVTEAAGLRNPGWGTSAAFLDFDRDGRLDLVVVNYVDYDPSWPCGTPGGAKDYCAPKVFHGTVTRLFHNRGPGLKGEPVILADVTVPAGLARAPGPGLGVCCADFDGDGWPDIFVANDGKPNHLWINQKDGTFTEEGHAHGLALDAMAQAQAGMGVAVGDVNNDGMFDVYVTHLASERNTLWLQGPKRGVFRDRTAHAGLLRTDWRGTGFGTLMADFDHDGWLDLAVVNGRVARGTPTPNKARGPHWMHYTERNQLLRNDGGGAFRDVSRANPDFCGEPDVSRAVVRADFDGDGAPDLVVTTVGGRARLFHNVAAPRGHWLLVQAFDPRLKRDAYGAEVSVRTGERRRLRVVNPAESYLSSSDPRAHFGLGDADRYDSIEVRWPDGLMETFPGGPADRALVLRRGEGRAAATP